jgi:conflict system pore-forming effector with SLATT domain
VTADKDNKVIEDNQLPGLYQAANKASIDSQKIYYSSLLLYLLLLILAAVVSYYSADSKIGTIISALLFLITLGILIWLKVNRPDDTWYNGRAVAESVKTRAWRWMMRADPYIDAVKIEVVKKEFISDLKLILNQNKSIASSLGHDEYLKEPITDEMIHVRSLSISDRLNIYLNDRVNNQSNWYSIKSIFNKKRAFFWFCISVVIHLIAIVMLLFRVQDPELSLPIEVIATSASAVLTWLQAKKHNELAYSYSLTAHEIVLIKGEGVGISTEDELSDYVVNTEAAFSREHTQWVARKND